MNATRTQLIALVQQQAERSNCSPETAARVLGLSEKEWEDIADEFDGDTDTDND